MKSFYLSKIAALENELAELRKQSDRFSRIRLYLFLLSCAVCFVAFKYISVIVGMGVLLCCLIIFVLFTRRHRHIDKNSEWVCDLLRIYRNETTIKQQNIFGEGTQYMDDKHPYSSDLDLFGAGSVFSYINRTVTYEGSNRLAACLSAKTSQEHIIQRQNIVKELAQKEAFKERFLSAFFLSKISTAEESKRMQAFMDNFQPTLHRQKFLQLSPVILPLLIIFSFAAGYLCSYCWGVTIIAGLVSLFTFLRNNKKVNEIENYVGKSAGLFYKYSCLMELIAKEPFQHPELRAIQTKIGEEYKFHKELRRLSKLLDKMEYRGNMLVGPVLNILFLWEIRYAIAIEKWFVRNRRLFALCLQQIGWMDAYLSMSLVHFNHPQWAFPAVTDDYFHLKADEIAHPLIDLEHRVANQYTIGGTGRVDIITGSNMAGKSTFLRTLGVNMVLAFAGMPACAASLTVSLADIHTYMRIRDSLNENTSSFYAELLRLKSIIEEIARNKRCFLLLDELLRGTNSKDKYTGSVALVKNFIKNDTVALVATHDLELTKMAINYSQQVSNYHFDITIHNDEFFFDYKLRQGICQTFNACLLMKKIGIEVEE